MPDKMKEVLHEEASNLQAVAHDIAVSGAYLYPVKGLIYLTTHKPLWHALLPRAMQIITLGLAVTTTMFFFTYIPQATIMTVTSGPLAPISAILLVLSESSTITRSLARSFLLAGALDETFDKTMVERGYASLVAGRRVKDEKFGIRESLMPTALGRDLLLLPVNFVPVLGTLLYVYFQGRGVGSVVHTRYFLMKGWDRARVEKWVRVNRGGYTGFGMVAFLFEMVPFASVVFSFSNTVGAALWAADIEKVLV